MERSYQVWEGVDRRLQSKAKLETDAAGAWMYRFIALLRGDDSTNLIMMPGNAHSVVILCQLSVEGGDQDRGFHDAATHACTTSKHPV